MDGGASLTREELAAAGYVVHPRASHVGPRWTWNSPWSFGGIIDTEAQAFAQVQAEFARDVGKARALLAAVQTRKRARPDAPAQP